MTTTIASHRRAQALRLDAGARRRQPRARRRHHRPARAQRRRQDDAACGCSRPCSPPTRAACGCWATIPPTATSAPRSARRLGYMPQEPGFHQRFTAFEFVDYVAILKEMTDRRARHDEVRRVLDARRPRRRRAAAGSRRCRAACAGASRSPRRCSATRASRPRRADGGPRSRAAAALPRARLAPRRRTAPCCSPPTRPRTSRRCAAASS